MNNQQIKEYLKQIGSELPLVPIKWLKQKAPKFNKKYDNKRKLLYEFQVLYTYKDISFTLEICYHYDMKEKPMIISQNIFGAKYKDTFWKNAYYIINYSYRARSKIMFSKVHKQSWNSDYIFKYEKVYKGSNILRSLHNLYNATAQYETFYKLGLKHLHQYTLNQSNKPIVALGLDKYMSKTQFKRFLEWRKQFKSFKVDIYRDFLKMAKNRNHKNIFMKTWEKKHDIWAGIAEQKENAKKWKQDKIAWNKISDIVNININPMESEDEMKRLGKELNNCLKEIDFDYKHIYKITSWETETPLALEYTKEEGIVQLYGYKNGHVSNEIHNLIKEAMQSFKAKQEREVQHA